MALLILANVRVSQSKGTICANNHSLVENCEKSCLVLQIAGMFEIKISLKQDTTVCTSVDDWVFVITNEKKTYAAARRKSICLHPVKPKQHALFIMTVLLKRVVAMGCFVSKRLLRLFGVELQSGAKYNLTAWS